MRKGSQPLREAPRGESPSAACTGDPRSPIGVDRWRSHLGGGPDEAVSCRGHSYNCLAQFVTGQPPKRGGRSELESHDEHRGLTEAASGSSAREGRSRLGLRASLGDPVHPGLGGLGLDQPGGGPKRSIPSASASGVSAEYQDRPSSPQSRQSTAGWKAATSSMDCKDPPAASSVRATASSPGG